MIGPVYVAALLPKPGFLILFILPALLKQSLLLGLITWTTIFFLWSVDPPLFKNLIPSFDFLSLISTSSSLVSVTTFLYTFSYIGLIILLEG